MTKKTICLLIILTTLFANSIAFGLSPVESIELEATVYDNKRNPIDNAQVISFYKSTDRQFSSTFTSGSGRTDGLQVPIDEAFYLVAEDENGQTYGGKYDFYFKRDNFWITDASGKKITNTSTGTTRLPYLHLFPEVIDPDKVVVESTNYKCGGFPDAKLSDLNQEACDAIEFVKEQGIFTGNGKGEIELARPINRAEVAKVMLEAFKYELLTNFDAINKFPDIGSNEWYTKYVYTARKNKIVNGYPDGFFKPTDSINRVELLRMFIEASKTDLSTISSNVTLWNDIEVNTSTQWYIKYANFAFENDLLNNKGSLNPGSVMTRLDVILLLFRNETT